MIDGLLFDKDGTLFDFRVSWGRWAQTFLTRIASDAAHARRLGRAIGFDLDTGAFAPDSPVIAATAADIAAALAPEMPGVSVADLTDRIDASAAQAPMSEAVPLRPLLSALRDQGLRIGLATNDSELPARQHLANHGLTDCFDFISGYDSGHGAKPGPGMCLAFARQLGLRPSRVAMVGDSRHDLEAGRAAGMRTVAVLTGIAKREELAPHADVVLADIGAIPGWLSSLEA
ncbi:HAD family hydrolase [Tabrizicola sp.]|jgi:phosphoglycolate phosphatase|uniref:HAD family hydrolase n=1 Tax=Tabrizicola sp. TaxID=2005166 RepID=UPI0025D144B3|nr:HAD family hydrolase [Tabrizicola sp.]MBY0351398.1 HAD family hydrolase [Tabrizicola sp.]MDK2775442.1 HAD family hydrolase [Tabrizicola sp.]